MPRNRGPVVVKDDAAHPKCAGADGGSAPQFLPPSALVIDGTRDYSTRYHGSSYETLSNETLDETLDDNIADNVLSSPAVDTHTSSYGHDYNENEFMVDSTFLHTPQTLEPRSGMEFPQTFMPEGLIPGSYQNFFDGQSGQSLPVPDAHYFAPSYLSIDFMDVVNHSTPDPFATIEVMQSEPSSSHGQPLTAWDHHRKQPREIVFPVQQQQQDPMDTQADDFEPTGTSSAYLELMRWDEKKRCTRVDCINTPFGGGSRNEVNSRIRHEYYCHAHKATLEKEGELDRCPLCDSHSPRAYQDMLKRHIERHHPNADMVDLHKKIQEHREAMKMLMTDKLNWKKKGKSWVGSIASSRDIQGSVRPTSHSSGTVPSLSHSLQTRSTDDSSAGFEHSITQLPRKLPERVRIVEREGYYG